MISSLRFRLWLTYALLIGVMLGILSASLILYLTRNPPTDRQTIQQLTVAAENLSQFVETNLPAAPAGRLGQLIQRAGERVDFRILLVNQTDGVIADTGAGESPPLKLSPTQLRQGQGMTRDPDGRFWLFVVQPLEGDLYLATATLRPRRVALLINTIVNVFGDELLAPFLQAGLVALVLALILSVFMARWISAPLQKMARAANAVSAGTFESLPLEGPNEVQALANAFNDMTTRVNASQQSQHDFVANVSHELKTPLTSIQGFSQAILDGTVTSDAELKKAAEVIHTEASRMHRMVVDLLDLARLDAGTMEFNRNPVDIGAILQQVTEKFSPQAKKSRVDLWSDIKTMPIIIADGDRLAQVFTNLVDNAIKFTPENGQIKIQASQVEDWVRIAITDTGPGIPQEEIERIFERFYQLDKSRRGGSQRGAGLGLTIAQEIVYAHRGKMTVQSQTGIGSVFVVDLPIARPDDSTLVARRKVFPSDP
jgi:signal transduction histidine kinase